MLFLAKFLIHAKKSGYFTFIFHEVSFMHGSCMGIDPALCESYMKVILCILNLKFIFPMSKSTLLIMQCNEWIAVAMRENN